MTTIYGLGRMLNIGGTEVGKTNTVSSLKILTGGKDKDWDEHTLLW